MNQPESEQEFDEEYEQEYEPESEQEYEQRSEREKSLSSYVLHGLGAGLFAALIISVILNKSGQSSTGIVIVCFLAFGGIGSFLGLMISGSVNSRIRDEEIKAEEEKRREAKLAKWAAAEEQERERQWLKTKLEADRQAAYTQIKNMLERRETGIRTTMDQMGLQIIGTAQQAVKDFVINFVGTISYEKMNIRQLPEIASDLLYLVQVDGNNSMLKSRSHQIQDILRSLQTSLTSSVLLLPGQYGVVKQEYLKAIQDSKRFTNDRESEKERKEMLGRLMSTIQEVSVSRAKNDQTMNEGSGLAFDWSAIVFRLWKHAIHRPHDAEKFKEACQIYDSVVEQVYVDNNRRYKKITGLDGLLSELYVAKEMGSGVLEQKRKKAEEWLQYYIDRYHQAAPASEESRSHAQACENLASGLMWLKAFEIEMDVLRKMAVSGVAMKEELQERLRFLESGKGKSYSMYEVTESADYNALDYASIHWSSEDYADFFKVLKYENKKLGYALTIREWTKTLSFTHGGPAWKTDELNESIEKMIREEYGSGVESRQQTFHILDNDTSAEVEGILLKPSRSEMGFDHIAVLLNLFRVGKNLNIRLYTLFMPTAEDTNLQEKQARSLKQNTSPNIAAIEEGLRESVLRKLEELINTSPKVTAKDGEVVSVKKGEIMY